MDTTVAGCNGPPASPSAGKRASRFCDACGTASCGHGLAACGSNGTGCKAWCPAGPASCGFCPCHTLDPPSHRGSRRQVLEHPISTSEVTPLPFPQVQPQRRTFAVADPMSLLVMPPLVRSIRRGSAPLLRLDAVGWALRSVASIISTFGFGASHGSAESGGPMASDGSEESDGDNPEKIRSKISLSESEQRRQRLSRVLWGPSAAGASTRTDPFGSRRGCRSTPFWHRPASQPVPWTTRGGCLQPAPGSAQTTGPSPIPLVLPWGTLSPEGATPHITGPDPSARAGPHPQGDRSPL